jgi:hypothetical protein
MIQKKTTAQPPLPETFDYCPLLISVTLPPRYVIVSGAPPFA